MKSMKQWKTTSSNDYIIDSRNKAQILAKFKELAASYTPEWQFDPDDPDIGTILAMLFSDQLEEHIKRYNSTLETDYVELANMLGISPRPAYPAHSIVLMNMIRDTIPGQRLKKGTKLIGSEDEENPIIFETAHSVYLTEARLATAFMASGLTGKVIPLKGDFAPLSFITGKLVKTEEEESLDEAEALEDVQALENRQEPVEEDEEAAAKGLQPFNLFDFSGQGYGLNGLMMYHSHLFDEVDNDIYMELKDGEPLACDIVSGKYDLLYYTKDGFLPITDIRLENNRFIVFKKDKECARIKEAGKEFSALLLRPKNVVEKNVTVSDVRFSSSGKARRADYIGNGNNELDALDFRPFGNNLALYSEFYIGHKYFSNPGALVSIDFDLSFMQNVVKMPEAQEDGSLKIIKRKQKKDTVGAVAEVHADEVSFEYYNGKGWKKLPLKTPSASLFKDKEAGHCQLEFDCPEDLKPMETGSYMGPCIRVQLLRADNCYFQPALHHSPIIKNLTVSYTYKHHFARPERLISFVGSKQYDVTHRMEENDACPVLFRSPYNDTALYLGFDRKMEDGPIGLFFKLDETDVESIGRLRFYYSSRKGFTRLKITDRTDGMNHTGTVLFMPPADMAKKSFEGNEAYWIKIEDEDNFLEKNPGFRPTIIQIEPNAVEADNIETMAEEEYYIDAFEPDMSFPLSANGILSVDVWVNETGTFSQVEMNNLLLDRPYQVYAEKDIRGEIRDFYIKWKEVDNFDHSHAGDRHYVIDRINNRIIFGDGVNVAIPKNTTGVAFKTIVHCCDGKAGNLQINAVDDSMSNIQFLEEIRNPIQAYGGMDMETLDDALRRGTALLNSRKRLISTIDYERAVLDYSHSIVQAKAITGAKKDGTYDPAAVSLVLLMEDYKDGRFSFINIRRRLKDYLKSSCELSVTDDKLSIVEPIFMEVSVEAWIKVVSADDSFEVQQRFIDILDKYLDPVENTNWEIGQDVVSSQIELRLNMEKGSALIRKMMITCRYKDENGWHEAELDAMRGNPYTIVTSGNHKIHFE